MAYIYDNFDDNNLDLTKWNISAIGDGSTDDILEQNQRLEMSLSSLTQDSRLDVDSSSHLLGDFDIQVDWNFSPLSVNTSWSLFYFVIDNNNWFRINREKSALHGQMIYTVFKIGGSEVGVQIFSTSVTSGKFRLKRTGSIAKTYYDIGSGWVELGSRSGFSTSKGYASLRLQSADSLPNASCWFDNFIINSGTFLQLSDISNDFRTREYWILNDISNDFRMIGTLALTDINNDFRFADYANININNDFRMIGELVLQDLNNDFRNRKEELYNINNKFDMIEQITPLPDINNKFNSCIEVKGDISNAFNTVKLIIEDISNDFRTKKDTIINANNDFRMVSSWQLPGAGEVGFQSAGKTEVKVYISTIEQTDINVDSITISQILNGSHTASFNLARAYDATKPVTDSAVEIKYKGILLYKGYITEVNPGDSPESIRVVCQDEYWNLNKDKKYFFVGRKPVDTNEYYYETIKDALTGLGLSYDIGDFIPQTMDLYGYGHSDAITNLVQNSGNFGWFIKLDGTKTLWQADRGNIIDLEPQQLGTNLGLYQVIRHSIRENIDNIINKLRVLMGNWTIRQNSDNITEGSGSKTYYYTYYTRHEIYAYPAWDSSLEALQKDSSDGYGYDNQDPSKDYKNVFKKFYLPSLDPELESWTDRYPPLVELWWGVYPGWTNLHAYTSEGFSINYGFQVGYDYTLGASDIATPSITFSEPQMVYDINTKGECNGVRSKVVRLYLWKENRVSYTINPQTDPDDEPDENALMFYTEKMGTYPEIIIGDLNLSSLSIQEGYTLKDDEGNIIENIPSWDDTEFAKDYADWQLSKTCDKKYIGSIDLTIDAMLYYNIDLSKRIKISGVVDPVNIISITYNFSNFIATLSVESKRYYERSENIQYRGE